MKSWKIDVAVLCIFFVRDEQFKKSFEQVKKARPRVLLLWQDGPRESNPKDIEGIMKCRHIAEDIDWDCKVYKMYNQINYGCDPSTFYAHKWAFSIVDECIILEDDVVVSQSFFTYCKELLDRYESDSRINRICGMNNIGILENSPYDYFFSTTGSVWGWATWKRVADTWDHEYSFLDNQYHIELLKKIKDKKRFPEYLKKCIRHRETGKPHWETINSFSAFLNSRLNIIPTKNMVCNIGVTENATHSVSDIKYMPKGLRKVFNMEVFELEGPINHPPYVIENVEYKEKYMRVMGVGHPLVRYYRRFESLFLRLKYDKARGLWKMISKKILKNRYESFCKTYE